LLPTLAVVLGMIMNGLIFNVLSARMSSLEVRMLALENRVLALEMSVNQRLGLLIGKLAEMGTRLSVLIDRFKR